VQSSCIAGRKLDLQKAWPACKSLSGKSQVCFKEATACVVLAGNIDAHWPFSSQQPSRAALCLLPPQHASPTTPTPTPGTLVACQQCNNQGQCTTATIPQLSSACWQACLKQGCFHQPVLRMPAAMPLMVISRASRSRGFLESARARRSTSTCMQQHNSRSHPAAC